MLILGGKRDVDALHLVDWIWEAEEKSRLVCPASGGNCQSGFCETSYPQS